VGKKGSRAQGTGSHVIWDGKQLTSREKGMAGSGWGKTAEEGGLKVQSPIQASREILDSKKRRHVGKQKIIYSSVL